MSSLKKWRRIYLKRYLWNKTSFERRSYKKKMESQENLKKNKRNKKASKNSQKMTKENFKKIWFKKRPITKKSTETIMEFRNNRNFEKGPCQSGRRNENKSFKAKRKNYQKEFT